MATAAQTRRERRISGVAGLDLEIKSGTYSYS